MDAKINNMMKVLYNEEALEILLSLQEDLKEITQPETFGMWRRNLHKLEEEIKNNSSQPEEDSDGWLKEFKGWLARDKPECKKMARIRLEIEIRGVYDTLLKLQEKKSNAIITKIIARKSNKKNKALISALKKNSNQYPLLKADLFSILAYCYH